MHPDPAEAPEAQPRAEEPALMATFYVEKEKEVTDRLQEELCQGLSLERYGPGKWGTSEGNWTAVGEDGDNLTIHSAFMLRFDLRAVPADSTFLQVVLNSQGDVEEAWEECRRRLEECLGREALKEYLKPEAPDGVWGYTLHYQATLNPGYDPEEPEETFAELRRSARLLHSDKGPYAPLVQDEMTEGGMWLLNVPITPTESDGLEAGTVYIALEKPDQGIGFDRVLLGESALGKTDNLLVPELIAHKSYYEERQYQGKEHEKYKRSLRKFRKLIRKLLNELEDREVPTGELRELTQHYHDLARMVWQREDLRISVVQQLHNYDEWEVTGSNKVFQYHRRHIENASVELELLVSEGQYALGVADPVISMSRYRAEKAEERNQQRRQILLALVAAVLALSQLLDKDVTGSLIAWIFALEPSEVSTSDAFWVQIGLILAILTLSSLIWLGVRRWRNRRRKSQSSEDK